MFADGFIGARAYTSRPGPCETGRPIRRIVFLDPLFTLPRREQVSRFVDLTEPLCQIHNSLMKLGCTDSAAHLPEAPGSRGGKV